MTTEEAMGWFERRAESFTLEDRCAEAERVALAALQEQQKRQSGCVWCKENGMVTHNGQHYELFCSYCGRRLEVEGKSK
jgi:hypothetical protein